MRVVLKVTGCVACCIVAACGAIDDAAAPDAQANPVDANAPSDTIAQLDTQWTSRDGADELPIDAAADAQALSELARVTGVPSNLAIANGYLYCVDGVNVGKPGFQDTIVRVPLVKGGITTLDSADDKTAANDWPIVIDGSHVYWTRELNGDEEITALPIAGGTHTALATEMGQVSQLVATSDALYFASEPWPPNTTQYRIRRLPKGGGPSIAIATANESVGALLFVGSMLYWYDGASSHFMSVSAAGGTPRAVGGLVTFRVGALASDGQRIYVASTGGIYALSLADGSTSSLVSGLREISSLVLDGTDLYFADGADYHPVGVDDRRIDHVKTSGGTVDELAAHQGSVTSIAVSPTDVYWATTSDFVSGTIVRMRR